MADKQDTVGVPFQRIRETLGSAWTQKRFAKTCKVPVGTFRWHECGRKKPAHYTTLYRLVVAVIGNRARLKAAGILDFSEILGLDNLCVNGHVADSEHAARCTVADCPYRGTANEY